MGGAVIWLLFWRIYWRSIQSPHQPQVLNSQLIYGPLKKLTLVCFQVISTASYKAVSYNHVLDVIYIGACMAWCYLASMTWHYCMYIRMYPARRMHCINNILTYILVVYYYSIFSTSTCFYGNRWVLFFTIKLTGSCRFCFIIYTTWSCKMVYPINYHVYSINYFAWLLFNNKSGEYNRQTT